MVEQGWEFAPYHLIDWPTLLPGESAELVVVLGGYANSGPISILPDLLDPNAIAPYATASAGSEPEWWQFGPPTPFTGGFLNDFGNLDLAVANIQPSEVPEPATLFLMASGLAGLGVLRRRMRG